MFLHQLGQGVDSRLSLSRRWTRSASSNHLMTSCVPNGTKYLLGMVSKVDDCKNRDSIKDSRWFLSKGNILRPGPRQTAKIVLTHVISNQVWFPCHSLKKGPKSETAGDSRFELAQRLPKRFSRHFSSRIKESLDRLGSLSDLRITSPRFWTY